MCTRTQDRQGTPARSASKTSLAKVPATRVQDARIGYIQDGLVFETLRIINQETMAGSVQPRASSAPPSPAHTPSMSDMTLNILQWKANGISNKRTQLSIFLEAHNVKVVAIQESKLTAKSRSPNIQNYTLVRQDRRGFKDLRRRLTGLQTTATSSPARHRTYINLKKDDWTGYMQEIERKMSSCHLPNDCQKDEVVPSDTIEGCFPSFPHWKT